MSVYSMTVWRFWVCSISVCLNAQIWNVCLQSVCDQCLCHVSTRGLDNHANKMAVHYKHVFIYSMRAHVWCPNMVAHRETITFPPHKNDLSLVCRQNLTYNVKKNNTNWLTVSDKLQFLRKQKTKQFRDLVSVVPYALSEGTAAHGL